jgi:hypothetical protein
MDKKKLFLFFAATIIAVIIALNINLNIKSMVLPDVVLENIEAITEESSAVHVCPNEGGSCIVIIGDGQTSTTVHGWRN